MALAAGVACAALVVVVVLLIGSYTFLPAMIGNTFEQSIEDQLGLEQRPEVTVRSEPPPSMLLGNFTGGAVKLQGVDLGEVKPEMVRIKLDPFEMNLLGSMRGGPKLRGPLSGKLEVAISEQEVARLVEERLDNLSLREVSLEDGQVLVGTSATVLGLKVPVSVRGDVRVGEGSLVFEPERVKAFDVPISRDVTERIFSRSSFRYPLDDLPYGTRISDAEIKDNKLVLSGKIEHLRLDAAGG